MTEFTVVNSVDVGVTVTLPLFAIILLAVGPLCIISTALAVFGGGYWGHRRHQLHKMFVDFVMCGVSNTVVVIATAV